MTENICPDCGERNAGGAEFCGACGAFLAWDTGNDAAAAPEPAGIAPPAAAPVGAQSAGSALSDSVAEPGSAGQPMWRGSEQLPGHYQEQSFGAPTVQSRTRPQGALLEQDPEPPSSEVTEPPTERPCPRCAVVNDAALRFCRKCGSVLGGPAPGAEPPGRRPAPERVPWWRRWFRPSDKTRRAARSAYRHSLPLRYRLVRWVLGLLGIGAIIGALTVVGQNPVGWVTDRVNDLRGALVQVEGLEAYSQPQESTGAVSPSGAASPSGGASAAPQATPDPAENVLDNRSDTAWTTAWSTASQLNPADAPCLPPSSPSADGGPGSILIVPSEALTLRQITVWAGRSKDDTRRLLEWRPKTVQLAFSDGTCQQLTLTDSEQPQEMPIDPVETTQIRLSVVDAYPPGTDQPNNLLAITDIRLFQRP